MKKTKTKKPTPKVTITLTKEQYKEVMDVVMYAMKSTVDGYEEARARYGANSPTVRKHMCIKALNAYFNIGEANK